MKFIHFYVKFVSVWSNLFNFARMFADHQRFSKVSIDHLFDNLDAKKIILGGKKS